MFKYFASFILIISLNLFSSDDAINEFTYNWLKRINDFIDDKRYDDAERELTQLSRKYFQNEQTYERALINQLFGNYYAIQGKYDLSVEYYEKALNFKKMPWITGMQVRKNLAQCHFQLTNYKESARLLEQYKSIALKRNQLFSPTDMVMLGVSYYLYGEYEKAYTEISNANLNSIDYKEDWLRYELVLAIKLEKNQEAVELMKLLVFVNPDKKEYWKQLSGFYYTQDLDSQSLAGLELAYEKQTLSKEKEFLDLARYYLYKNLPQKSVSLIESGIDDSYIEKTKENYELLADAYFLLKDRPTGIIYLRESFNVSNDANTAFKIGRFAFEEEDWKTAIQYFKEAQKLEYDNDIGRLDLLIGISFYEINDSENALVYLNNALDYEESKTSAEGWISFINELNS